MVLELKERIPLITLPLTSVYFGGGTPSLLTETELAKFLKNVPSLDEVQEITLEVNPEDLTIDNLTTWQQLGINRLSIGIQSLNEALLKWMNRNHTAKDAIHNLRHLSHFSFNCSVDLIYGIPGQTVNDLLAVKEIIEKPYINHVSAYALSVENKTLLAYSEAKSGNPLLDENHQSRHYYEVQQLLAKFNYEQYEVSSYARNKTYAKHNQNYWKRVPYLGIGPGAHSYDGKKIRRWNVSNNFSYMQQQNWFEEETLTDDNLWNELWLTSLRTCNGVDMELLASFGGLRTKEHQLLEELIRTGDLVQNNHHYQLTRQGLLKADRFSALFFRV